MEDLYRDPTFKQILFFFSVGIYSFIAFVLIGRAWYRIKGIPLSKNKEGPVNGDIEPFCDPAPIGPKEGTPVPDVLSTGKCPNCGRGLFSEKRKYCSDRCRKGHRRKKDAL